MLWGFKPVTLMAATVPHLLHASYKHTNPSLVYIIGETYRVLKPVAAFP